jgi:arylsulfatase A
MKNIITGTAVLLAGVSSAMAVEPEQSSAKRPNIVYILVDDMGYGDVHCLNPEHSKVATPNMDRLAAQGMIFTDAHATSAMCTPSRYSILTGRYNWRSRLQSGVLGPYDQPLIDRSLLTVPDLLKQNGYATACIGKWHLGWQWPKNAAKKLTAADTLAQGPTTRGFDYYFGQDTPSIPPFCFIQNDHILGDLSEQMPAGYQHNRPGAMAKGWKSEDLLPTLTDHAVSYIHDRAKQKMPFFLYFPLSSIHYPIAPTKEWQGKSGIDGMADFIMETDAEIGRVLAALDKDGLADNTLVVLSSDNGHDPTVDWDDLIKHGHFPSGPYRGCKSTIWDGGHRIPFIARWPGVINPGTHCGQLACEMDLMATCADMLGAKLPENAGVDSVSLLPLLRGGEQPVRASLVHHSSSGKFAIRAGNWKLELCPGSGGWASVASPTDAAALKEKLPSVQLYDVSNDEGERKNLQAQHPEIVAQLTSALKKIVAEGRSTPGPIQKNDVPVDIFKKLQ